jgi:hypothetical protein
MNNAFAEIDRSGTGAARAGNGSPPAAYPPHRTAYQPQSTTGAQFYSGYSQTHSTSSATGNAPISMPVRPPAPEASATGSYGEPATSPYFQSSQRNIAPPGGPAAHALPSTASAAVQYAEYQDPRYPRPDASSAPNDDAHRAAAYLGMNAGGMLPLVHESSGGAPPTAARSTSPNRTANPPHSVPATSAAQPDAMQQYEAHLGQRGNQVHNMLQQLEVERRQSRGTAAPSAGSQADAISVPQPTQPRGPVYQPPANAPVADQPQFQQSQVAQPQFQQSRFQQPQIMQPQFTQPQFTQPQFTQPQVTQPQFQQPQFSQPQFSQPQMNQPQMSQPQMSRPQMTQPQFGQPALQPPAQQGYVYSPGQQSPAQQSYGQSQSFSQAPVSPPQFNQPQSGQPLYNQNQPYPQSQLYR